MKPLPLFIASFVMLLFAAITFNWTGNEKPILVEILGVIGIFVWLPLLIIAIVWTRAGNGSRALVAAKSDQHLFTPLRLFVLGAASLSVAVLTLEYSSFEQSIMQFLLLGLSMTTGLVACIASIAWAAFNWRIGQR